MTAPRQLVLVLGDQLSHDNPALAGLDAAQDAVLMIEAPGEATRVWSHQARIAIFLAAMRHHAQVLRGRGLTVHYIRWDAPGQPPGLAARFARALADLRPQVVKALEPGEWGIEQDLQRTAAQAGIPLRWLDDPHFLCSRADFQRWAARKTELRMEFFYRWMRQRERVLMTPDGGPAGGRWNFDADNRSGYPKTGPGDIPAPARFEPDALTREVIQEVRQHFGHHPGTLDHFAWPVTREQALQALQRFIDARLVHFGTWQDAMWSDTPFGWHALLSSSINLHLLHPREVIAAAEAAWRDGRAALPDVEGFIRQILGWREFIRGVYWRDMPGMAQANHLQADEPLPGWWWTADTPMACLRDAIGQTLRHGYAHHIQRLMVTGLFALLARLRPDEVAAWYLAVYVDAVEWVELPNVAGMTLYANGGRFTSKPYAASGAYIQRMSNHCQGCRYKPAVKTGPQACPFTTLYWAFLGRHEAEFAAHPRTALMVKNLQRLGADERQAIRDWAEVVLDEHVRSRAAAPAQAAAAGQPGGNG
ncbi:MAG: cryptochrome/photolyase family protein [Pseudomonadota bacterium]